ncbi:MULTISPECIES: LLM class flavin-dependent oxidoreductase [Pseudomonadota]|jgi:FMN-dependent oxidoreductase (nitrilotriacetate monooxygenase family)|uniref:Xenobiotic compound monooxygenase, DszA family, A subunit n=1 Tax=Chelativorans sp. (strain BNC1) TaxID=266779 RepID=Q11H79_CHESB|nr:MULTISPECIES: LLM class flavin-dependent oxidoreductase [Chelativorans]
MRKAGEQMKLGAFLTATGQHIAAWRHPDVKADAGVDLQEYIRVVKIAERGKFDMMFLADNAGIWSRELESDGRSSRAAYFEPITLLSALAAVTERIGLVATATATFNEPYNVARKYASLDHLSGGRAGWNLVTSANEAEAYNFGFDVHLAHADRYARAREFAEIVIGLWDSWEDDALILDKEGGRFFDPQKLHMLNHKGERFSVRGPLNVPRTPQGRPIIVQAGSSDAGMDLAAWCADVVFTAQPALSDGITFYRELKERVRKAGRSPDDLKIMPGLSPVVGRTREEAQAKFQELQDLIDPVVGLGLLSSMAGHDLSGYPIDGPFPDLPDNNTGKGRLKVLKDTAARENMTIRQLYTRIAGTRGHNLVIGTAEDIADQMEEWFTSEAADGFNIMPQALPGSLSDFVDFVIPELQRRGLFRREYEGSTLREHLGLSWPHTRHVLARDGRNAKPDAAE